MGVLTRRRLVTLVAGLTATVGLVLIPGAGGADPPAGGPPGQARPKPERPCDPQPERGRTMHPPCASP